MSTDRSIQSETHRERSTDDCTTDRSQRYPGDTARLNGHELVAIDEWLPGKAPIPYEIDLTDSYEYRTRYWRCENCGQERNQRDEFTTTCQEPQSPTLLEAGGYSIDEPRIRRALTEEIDVQFVQLGPVCDILPRLKSWASHAHQRAVRWSLRVSDPTCRWECHTPVTPIPRRTRRYLIFCVGSAVHRLTF